jgi:hypothetical protein
MKFRRVMTVDLLGRYLIGRFTPEILQFLRQRVQSFHALRAKRRPIGVGLGGGTRPYPHQPLLFELGKHIDRTIPAAG